MTTISNIFKKNSSIPKNEYTKNLIEVFNILVDLGALEDPNGQPIDTIVKRMEAKERNLYGRVQSKEEIKRDLDDIETQIQDIKKKQSSIREEIERLELKD